MNVKDENFDELKQIMKDLIQHIGNHHDKKSAVDIEESIYEFYRLHDKFIDLSNTILKREWRKLKKNLRDDTLEVSALKSESDRDWIERQAFPLP